jgi:hypothetical protein
MKTKPVRKLNFKEGLVLPHGFQPVFILGENYGEKIY